MLLPHPHVWKEAMDDSSFNITQKTANQILDSYDWLDSGHKAMLDEYLGEIKRKAR